MRAILGTPARLSILLLLFFLFRAPFWDFVPIWDGQVYYRELVAALEKPFDPFNFVAFFHSSILYLPLMSLPEIVAPGNEYVFNFWLSLLTAAGIAAYHGILIFHMRERAGKAEILLWTSWLAFHPVMTSNTMNFNLDQGVVTFFLLYFWAFLLGRYRLAVLSGVVMVFTKEASLLLLPLPVVYGAIRNWATGEKISAEGKWRKSAVVLGVPTGLFLIFCFVARVRGFQATDTGVARLSFADVVSMLGPLHNLPFLRTFSAQIFVLNFNWLVSAAVVAGSFSLLVSGNRDGFRRTVPVLVLLVLIFYLLTRYAPFTNIRYVLPVLPVLLLAASVALVFALPAARARTLLAAAGLILFLAAHFRTFDPVSKRLFGTFEFGRHEVLRMTSMTGECCGPVGRDQLLYNLEFLKFHDLQNKAFADVKPNQDTCIVTDPFTTFLDPAKYGHLLTGRLDRATYRRTMDIRNSFEPRYSHVGESGNLPGCPGFPGEIYYFYFPIFEGGRDFRKLLLEYPEYESKIHESDGYVMKVYRLRRKGEGV